MSGRMPAADGFEEFEQLFGIRLDRKQKSRTVAYWHLLQRWNRKVRLISIRSFREALQFHFFETFWAAEHFLKGFAKIADIGSGAGFPGLAAKLYFPELQAALLESNRKKAVFLQEASRQLGLEAEVFPGRAEDYPHWPSIDIALMRALKSPPAVAAILCRHRIPLLCFHGSRLEAPGMELKRSQPVPGSRNRRASLLEPR